jgi:hypothetical protein
MFCAFDPFAINRACVAVVKCLFTSVWHSAHAVDPTYSAPGISGGTITTRFTVTHDISTPADNSAITIQPILRRRRSGAAGLGVFIVYSCSLLPGCCESRKSAFEVRKSHCAPQELLTAQHRIG